MSQQAISNRCGREVYEVQIKIAEAEASEQEKPSCSALMDRAFEAVAAIDASNGRDPGRLLEAAAMLVRAARAARDSDVKRRS